MSDTDDVRERIEEQYEFIQEANYYEILGVDESADGDEIADRFRELAKKWHADSFSDHDLDDATKQKLQQIFAELNNAYQTLSSPEDREEYNAVLETEDTDIESVIDAENSFRKGRNLLDAGRYEGAHQQFEEACERSPEDEPEYRAHRLYTEFLLLPKKDEGAPKDRERAQALFDQLDTISRELPDEKGWLFAFMGSVSRSLGRTQQAVRLLQEAKRLDTENRLAERQLRLIRRRNTEDEGGRFGAILDALPSFAGEGKLEEVSASMGKTFRSIFDRIDPDEKWREYLDFNASTLVILFVLLGLAIVLYGFVAPHEFPSKLRISWGKSIDQLEKNQLFLKQAPGTSPGFYRNATFEIGSSNSSIPIEYEVGRLEATASQDVVIRPLEGVNLFRVNPENPDDKTQIKGKKTIMKRGKIYQLGSIYLRIRRLL